MKRLDQEKVVKNVLICPDLTTHIVINKFTTHCRSVQSHALLFLEYQSEGSKECKESLSKTSNVFSSV
jgi:hypothetical protein